MRSSASAIRPASATAAQDRDGGGITLPDNPGFRRPVVRVAATQRALLDLGCQFDHEELETRPLDRVMPTEERMPVNDGGPAYPPADSTAAWWPLALGHHAPDDLLLVEVTSHELWTAEAWPRIGQDGRLVRGEAIEDMDPRSLEPAPLSGIGVALALRTERLDGQAQPDVAVIAVRRRRDDASDDPAAARLVAKIGSNVWDAALTAVWRPYAWTYWTVWRGDPELIAHVGRVMQWALHEVLNEPAHVQTTIDIGPDDVERFDEPSAVTADLTAYGARHMRTVKIATTAKGIDLAVHINTGEDADQPARSKAVLLEVTASSPDQLAAVRAIHARLRAAVERGRPKGMIAGESLVGHAAVDANGNPVPGLTRGPADAAERRNDGWIALGVVTFVIAWFVLPIVAEIVSGTTFLITALAIAAPLGALAAASIFGDGIMLGTSNRVLRLKAAAVALVGGAVSAGVITAIKSVLGLF
jgi:hypothetical protein